MVVKTGPACNLIKLNLAREILGINPKHPAQSEIIQIFIKMIALIS